MTRSLIGLTLAILALFLNAHQGLCYEFASAATISGTVVTTEGDKPLADAQVYATCQIFDNAGGVKVNFHSPLRTDKKGTFLLDKIVPGRYTLFALASGHEMAQQVVTITTDGDERDIVMTLTPVSSISGQIRDKNNKPMANALINFSASSLYRRIEGTTTTRSDGSYTIYLARSYKQFVGSMTIEPFPGQESQITSMTSTRPTTNTLVYTLSVKAPGYAFTDQPNLSVPLGKDVPNVNFTLTEKSSSVAGKVTSDDGRTPIPNAHVQLMRLFSGGVSSGGRQAFTRTGADGAFAFADVAPGEYQIYTSAPEFTPLGNTNATRIVVTTSAPTQGVHLMLSPAAGIEGTIYESDGKTPVRSQSVEIRAQMITEFGRSTYGTTLNTQDGRFSLTYLQPGDYEVFVFVEQRGIAQAHAVKLSKGEKLKDVQLRLGAEPLIVLTVRNAANKSLTEGAMIYMRTLGASAWWQVAKTDRQGTLRIGGLKPQRYFFWATSPALDGADFPRQNDEGVEVNLNRASGQFQADIALRGPALAVGRVLDEKKNPVVGAQLQMSPSSGGVVQSTVTDASGAFRVAPLRGDVYNLTIFREGYERYTNNVTINEGAENRIKDVMLTFLGFGAIRGRVVSGQGATRVSVKGAQVSLRRQRRMSSMQPDYSSPLSPPTVTDESGNFQLQNVPAGMYDVLISPLNGPVIVREQVVVKRLETISLGDISVPAAGALTGKIRTPDGHSLPYSTEVIVGPPGMSGGLVPIMVGADSRNRWTADQYAARVNPDGTFKVSGILPGRYEVIARGPGLLAPAPQLVEIKANQTANIVFSTPRSGKITGRVTNLATSQPMAGASVYLYDPMSNESLSSMTDAQGTYTIERVRPGVTRIVCRMRGYALASRFDVVVEEGETAIVDFLLTPGGSIAGQVKGGLTRRAYNSSLQVALNGNFNMAGYVRADGSYKIDNVPPGVYSVDLFIGNAGVLSIPGVVVEEGRETMGIDFESPR